MSDNAVTTIEQDDRFSIENQRLSQDFTSMAGVKKRLTQVPIRKPNRQDFVRVHPGEAYQYRTMVLELKEERETYMVAQDLWAELPGELTAKLLAAAINRQGVVFIWPIRLPGEDGRIDSWNESALEAATLAQTSWIHVAANMSLGGYEIFEASGDLPDPKWPEEPFQTLISIAFKNRCIGNLDHPAIKRLRGIA